MRGAGGKLTKETIGRAFHNYITPGVLYKTRLFNSSKSPHDRLQWKVRTLPNNRGFRHHRNGRKQVSQDQLQELPLDNLFKVVTVVQ
jgi:hypothetical protein